MLASVAAERASCEYRAMRTAWKVLGVGVAAGTWFAGCATDSEEIAPGEGGGVAKPVGGASGASGAGAGAAGAAGKGGAGGSGAAGGAG